MFENVPDVYGYATYGPPDDDADGEPDEGAAEKARAAAARAREVAAEMRAEMTG